MNLKILGSFIRLSFRYYNINKYDILLIVNKKIPLITFHDYKEQRETFSSNFNLFYIFSCNCKRITNSEIFAQFYRRAKYFARFLVAIGTYTYINAVILIAL